LFQEIDAQHPLADPLRSSAQKQRNMLVVIQVALLSSPSAPTIFSGSSRILVGEIEWPNVRNACGIWFSAAFVSLKTRHVFRR
jgi:hypothetical protein